MRATLSFVIFLLLLLSMTSATSIAQYRPPTFPKDSLSLYATTSYTHGFHEDAQIGSLQAGINYFIWDNFSLGVELAGHGVSQPGDDAWMIGLEGVARHHLFQWTKSTFFLDVSFGPAYAGDQVPEGGTNFNFITRAGVGITREIEQGLHLMVGVRYWHLSNARIHGVDQNPSINGIEGYVGLIWQL